jgi:lipopolysaccharide transport system permease protein
MLVVYTFVFSQIFKSRWNPQSDSKTEFALVLFAGLLIFNIFSECLNHAPRLILNNANYVKKVVFPLEILPWVNLYAALFHGFISLLVWMLAYCLFFGTPSLAALYLPIAILPFCLMVMGFSWILASLGVYLRDIGQFIGIAVTALMFLSPLFYPMTSLPMQYQSWVLLNPTTIPIQLTRDFLFFGVQPGLNIEMLLIYSAVAVVVAYLGFFWFQKTRKGFADVI